MSSSMGPFTPKSGWLTRWGRQGLSLLARSPEPLIAYVLLCGFVGTVHPFLSQGLFTAGIGAFQADRIAIHICCVIGIAGMVGVTNLIMRNDLGQCLSANQLWGRLKAVMPTILSLHVFFAMIDMAFVLLSPNEGNSPHELRPFFQGEINRWVLAVMTGGYLVSKSIFTICFIHVFLPSALAGTTMVMSDIRISDDLVRQRNMRIYITLVIFALFLPGLLLVLPVPGAMILLMFIAWNYCGGREVLGGIDGNGAGYKSDQSKMAQSPA